ncbi:MAG TPA: SRPBCC family protein [Chloroflexota bacterium]|nr:SRPBCC family protein [Chloroflexota bacterium]
MSKGQIRRSETVDAPAATVFRFLTDLERTPEWDPGVTQVRSMTRGPLRHGSIIRQTVERDGESTQMDDEVIDFDPPWRLAIRSVHGALNTISYALSEEADQVTRLEVTVSYELPDAPNDSPLSNGMIRQGMHDALGHALRRLKDAIEREPTT